MRDILQDIILKSIHDVVLHCVHLFMYLNLK